MKRIFPGLIFVLALGFASAAEKPREWTDSKGRKVTATLMDKSDTEADVLLKSGKRVKLKLSDLSEADQKYVTASDVLPVPDMDVRTIKVDSNEANTQYDKRSIQVTLDRVRGRSYTLRVVWLGPNGNTVGIFKEETVSADKDGKLVFTAEYKGGKSGSEYKGYAVALVEKSEFGDTIVARGASQKPFERFLEPKAEE
jgi:hypothetical protein